MFKTFHINRTKPVLDLSVFEDSQYESIENIDSILEKSATAPLNPQVWGDIKGRDDKEREERSRALYNEYLPLVVGAKAKFTRLLKKIGSKSKNSKVLVDIKAMDAFVKKVVLRGRNTSSITDWLRSAIIVRTHEDVDRTVKLIKKDFVVQEYEKKDKGLDKEYGYFGSHHFLVLVDGITCEIQVMTKKLWVYKEEAHLIYGKYREDKGEMDKKLKKLELAYSKELFSRGNSR